MVILYRFDNSAIIECDSFEDLTQLENYNDVEYINWSQNQLTVLPELPSGLKYLNCTGNQLTVLPELPPGLKTLNCSQNQLTILLVLPKSLEILGCSNNNLTVLPELPESLTGLYCTGNKLTSLPELPNSLKTLECSYNSITRIPVLPDMLSYIWYTNNPIYIYIKKYCNGDIDLYHKINKIFANKIDTWFLKCKYNPEYKYCRDRVNAEYDNLLGKYLF